MTSRSSSPSDAAVELLLAQPAVDVHSHAGTIGVLSAAPPSGDLAAAMREGDMAAVCLAGVPDWPLLGARMRGDADPSIPDSAELYSTHVEHMDWIDELVASHGVRRAITLSDLHEAHSARVPSVIHTVEGLDFLDGRLERLAEARDRGVRVAQLVHYTPTVIGDFQTGEVVHNGLTDFGAESIRECNRLGLVVDVAHATEETVRQATSVTTTPLLLSHTALRDSAAMDPDRLPGRRISREHARLVAQTDGAIGVWHFFSSLEAYVEGIKEVVAVVGVDHVAIGTDQQVNEGALQNYGDLGHLVDLLLQDGFAEAEVAQLVGGNFLRIFGRAASERGD